MSFEITGVVKTILSKQQIIDKLTKQVLVIEVPDDKYPQVISLEAVNDRCKLLDPLGAGQEVTAHFNLKGREWTNKQGVVQYFNTLDLWKVEVNTKAEDDEPIF